LLIAGGFEVNRFGSGEFDEFGADEFGACTCGFGACGWEGISYEIGCLFQSINPNTFVFLLSSNLLLPYFLKNLHVFLLMKNEENHIWNSKRQKH
jgi:hypothetical protein